MKSETLTFSLLISTRARPPTALAILLARVLNAPHCLQASTITTGLPPEAAFFGTAAFLGAALDFLAGAFATVFFAAFLALAGAFFGAAVVALEELRVDRRVPTMMPDRCS